MADEGAPPGCEGWRRPPPRLTLAPDTIDVWRVRLDALDGHLRLLSRVLSERERSRGARYRFERDRAEYVASHACLRLILAHYLPVSASQVQFGQGEKGKPHVLGGEGERVLQFNMASSHALALYGVGPSVAIGVDLEWMHSDRVDEALISQLLAPEEKRALDELPDEMRRAAFYACWTRKEAFLKATGEGLYYPLEGFAVSVDPREPPRLLRVGDDDSDATRWSLYPLQVADGYAATLVAEGRDWRLRCWELDPELIYHLSVHGR